MSLIRQLSKGARSLDDFCRAFEGGPGGAPAMKPYNFEDVVAALNAVQPYDWADFLNSRLRSTEPHAPLGGIEHSGWKLVYDGARSEFLKAEEAERKMIDLSYSLGLKVKEDGTVVDIAYGGPAQKAGIAPAVTIMAVNNRQFTPTVLREAVAGDGLRHQAAGTADQDRRVLRDAPDRLSRRRTIPPPGARPGGCGPAIGDSQAAGETLNGTKGSP